jgi:aspartate/glutamate racemase
MEARMNKKIKFGIISGAGPMAGALLYQLVIKILQARGAWHDADFPEILLLNIPFSDMLSTKIDSNKIRIELLDAVRFTSHYVDYVYVACQTLHVFLTPDDIIQYKIISLLDLIKPNLVTNTNRILVVGSHTSRLFQLHSKLLQVNCCYAEPDLSEQAINSILKGKMPDLSWLEELAKENTVILGCTEFSIAMQKSKIAFIDPIKLAAHDIVNKFQIIQPKELMIII